MTKDYLQIGIIKKTFGKKGELVIYPVSNFDFDKINENDWLFIDIDSELVPFKIEDIDVKSDELIHIKFEDITFDNAAKFTGLNIFLHLTDKNKKLIPNKEDLYSVEGYKVIDEIKGEIGIVDSIIHNQMQDILQVISANDKILIPVNENIIQQIDKKKKIIYINAPEGLLDLNL